MEIYSNKSEKFQILDFSATHSQLLIRSMKSRERNYNVDIIMKGVRLSILPTEFDGFEITILEDEKTADFLKEKFSFNTEYDNHIYLIKDNSDKQYFINALCFGVYHNELDILETSIGRYEYKNFGELQKWYDD